jgi:hypothetical protein
MATFEEQVFVTRFWRAADAPEGLRWRGCVDHLPTARRRFFVELADLSAFIAACLYDDAPSDVDTIVR